MTGHECWMAGASEIIYSSLMMQNNFIAPNINFESPDEDTQHLNIIKNTTDKNINVFLSNSLIWRHQLYPNSETLAVKFSS